MPSFLSKVFGRKKGDEKDSTPRSVRRSSDPSLLEGKFEAVPSTISPSSPKFPEDVHGDKGRPFGLLRSRSKPQPSCPTTDAPHLTLRLPGTIDKNGDSFVASFDPEAAKSDDSIWTRRLTPEETLSLIEACSKAITERGGLETLGVMRPYWHSASPQLQRKLISLFILSLAHSPDSTLAPTTSPLAAFNSELEYTRSVHDIAAVFRWALRHLELKGTSFGSSPSSDEWSWYRNFYETERKSDHDPRVFTTGLVPELPPTHTTLLLQLFDIISSLAAHAEANGYSGSKLTKYFGFWLLTARRAAETEDWNSFYSRWEVSGRMLEHLFLSWLRDENTKRPLPRRLQELVAQYPYTMSPDPTVDGLLTRPRFSTRRHDALFVRVEAVYADSVPIPSSRSPVGIFVDALESQPKSDSGAQFYLWDHLKATVVSDSGDKPLLAILSDDTVNTLSLVSTDPKEQALLGISTTTSTLVSPLSPVTEAPLSPKTISNGTPVPVRKPTPTPSAPQSPKDWTEFSNAGFGETTIPQNFASILLDKDVEVTEPPVQRKLSKKKRSKEPITPVEPTLPAPDSKPAPEEPEGPKLILVATEIVQLDEAFIDFWRDAIVDPISSDWPKFVIGELNHPLIPHPIPASSEDGENVSPAPIKWIIIEEKFRKPPPPPTPVVPQEALSASSGLRVPAIPLKRSSSPRPSFGEKRSASLSATLKRFTLFGSSKDDLATDETNPTTSGSNKKDSSGGKKKFGIGKSPMLGEMGEVLSEEPEPQVDVPKKVDESDRVEKIGKGEVVAVATGAVGGAVLAAAVVGDEAKKVKVVEDEPTKEGANELLSFHRDGTDPVVLPPAPDIPAPEEPAPVPLVTSATEHAPLAEVLDAPIPGPTPKTESGTLLPAPGSIISHGETPGPQLALDSTEVGLHHVPDVDEPRESTTQPADVPLSEPVTQHLEDKAEDPAADVGVDLDPVPIVANHPVEVEAEEPEVAPELDVVESTSGHVVDEPEVVEVAEVEEPSSPPPHVPVSEEPEKGEITSTQPAQDEQEPADVPHTPKPEETVETTDVDPEDAPVVENVLEAPTSEPVTQQVDSELHPPLEEPIEVEVV